MTDRQHETLLYNERGIGIDKVSLTHKVIGDILVIDSVMHDGRHRIETIGADGYVIATSRQRRRPWFDR